MTVKKKSKSEKTRSRIIDTYFELSLRNPGLSVNVSEICNELDIYRSTFYYHFDSVEDMLNDVSLQLEADLQNYINGMVELGIRDDAQWQIKNLLDGQIHFIYRHRRYYAVLLDPAEEYYFRTSYRNLLFHSIRSGIRLENEAKADSIAEFITDGLLGSIYRWIRTESMPVGEFTKLILDTTGRLMNFRKTACRAS